MVRIRKLEKSTREGEGIGLLLLDARLGTSFFSVLEGFKEIFINSKQRKKYLYLFALLEKAGFVILPSELRSSVINGAHGASSLIQEIQVIRLGTTLRVVHILPQKVLEGVVETSIIGFDDIVDLLIGKKNDRMALEFAKYLQKWQNGTW